MALKFYFILHFLYCAFSAIANSSNNFFDESLTPLLYSANSNQLMYQGLWRNP